LPLIQVIWLKSPIIILEPKIGYSWNIRSILIYFKKKTRKKQRFSIKKFWISKFGNDSEFVGKSSYIFKCAIKFSHKIWRERPFKKINTGNRANFGSHDLAGNSRIGSIPIILKIISSGLNSNVYSAVFVCIFLKCPKWEWDTLEVFFITWIMLHFVKIRSKFLGQNGHLVCFSIPHYTTLIIE
jgi:hypothetical protein